MKRNFAAKSETTLQFLDQDLEVDLHNDFVFGELLFSPLSRATNLVFNSRSTPSSSRLLITFNSISVIRLHGLDVTVPAVEGECLDSFGYLHPDDLDIMDGFLPERYATESHHMIFLFRGGISLKVYGQRAKAEILRV